MSHINRGSLVNFFMLIFIPSKSHWASYEIHDYTYHTNRNFVNDKRWKASKKIFTQK